MSFGRWQVFPFLLCFAVASGSWRASANSVVAIGDEWLLSDEAFGALPDDAALLAANLASLLGGGGAANFLAYSNDANAFGSSLTATLTGAGHGFVIDTSFVLTEEALAPYDAVLLAGSAGASDLAVLQAYVAHGGSLAIMAGTGAFGNASAEATAWNPLLAPYGLAFGDQWFDVAATVTVAVEPGAHPLRAGLASVRWGFGQEAAVLDPALPGALVAISGSFDGTGGSGVSGIQPLIAVFSVPEPLAACLLAPLLAGLGVMRRRAYGAR